jgi:transcriptional regulator of arginine metabolism
VRKSERLDLLKQAVEKLEIATQNDLVAFFERQGVTITQATISRDIKELGLVKLQAGNGRFRYLLPNQSVPTSNPLAAIRSKMCQGEMLRLNVAPGTAMSLKNYLALQYVGDIFALLADDDCVLMILKSKEAAKQVFKELG